MATQFDSGTAPADLQTHHQSLTDQESRPGSPATSNQASSLHDDVDREGFTLPQADGGKAAWLLLVGCFWIEALIWGNCLPSPIHSPTYSVRVRVDTSPSVSSLCITFYHSRLSCMLFVLTAIACIQAFLSPLVSFRSTMAPTNPLHLSRRALP